MVDISTIKPEGILDDLVVFVDSWEYTVEFVLLQPKSHLGGHPLILGRPCLATTDAYISYRLGSWMISNGIDIKNLTLYPLVRPISDVEIPLGMDFEEEEDIQPLLTIGRYLTFKT